MTTLTLRRALLAAMLVATAAVGACNTAEGIGKDVEFHRRRRQGHRQRRQEVDHSTGAAGAGRRDASADASAGIFAAPLLRPGRWSGWWSSRLQRGTAVGS